MRPTKRPAAGAALPSERVTAALLAATLAELARCGYGSLRMEAVARRAGVGKAALYRRWPSKLELTQDVLARASVAPAPFPDTGSLRADVDTFLRESHALLAGPDTARLFADLTAEALRTPELAELLDGAIGGPRRARAATLIELAVERGELRTDVDRELALDFLPAALHWRMVVRRRPVDGDDLGNIATAIVAALQAL